MPIPHSYYALYHCIVESFNDVDDLNSKLCSQLGIKVQYLDIGQASMELIHKCVDSGRMGELIWNVVQNGPSPVRSKKLRSTLGAMNKIAISFTPEIPPSIINIINNSDDVINLKETGYKNIGIARQYYMQLALLLDQCTNHIIILGAPSKDSEKNKTSLISIEHHCLFFLDIPTVFILLEKSESYWLSKSYIMRSLLIQRWPNIKIYPCKDEADFYSEFQELFNILRNQSWYDYEHQSPSSKKAKDTENNRGQDDNVVDILIITALPKERDAVIKRMKSVVKIEINNRFFYKGNILHENGQGSYTVVLLSMPGMGNVQAGIAATQAINIWNPSYIFLVGITAGIKKGTSQFLGDIIVGEQIVDYEFGKLTDNALVHRYQVIRTSFPLLEACKNLPPEKWVHTVEISRPDESSGRVYPQVHFGVVASGEKVVADSAFIGDLLSDWPKLTAVEMEGYGVALASYQAETNPHMLMVKGVCDFADSSKNDLWQEYSADAAAAYVFALLESAPFASKGTRP